jgi:aryl-alcohol dehydrogenase-like predicted oxidoreductase
VKYRRLGNTGLLVSEISYGTWITFGNQLTAADAQRMVNRALALGINYFDTADVDRHGEAEEVLGRALRSAAIRQDFVVATKAFFPMGEGVNNRGLSRKHLFDSVNDSLRRLGTDYIDLFYCHRFDDHTPLVETLQAMQDLIHAGKILHWGVSDWTADQIAEAASKCKADGWIPPSVDQPRYSLLHRAPERRVLPVCENHGIGVVGYSPLAEGLLTGKYAQRTPPDGTRASHDELNIYMREALSDRGTAQRIRRFVTVARDARMTPAQLALAVLLRRREVDSLIIGATTEAQLVENVKASGLRLEETTIDAVDELFPPKSYMSGS